jgi:hypothetical protein
MMGQLASAGQWNRPYEYELAAGMGIEAVLFDESRDYVLLCERRETFQNLFLQERTVM